MQLSIINRTSPILIINWFYQHKKMCNSKIHFFLAKQLRIPQLQIFLFSSLLVGTPFTNSVKKIFKY